MHFLDKSLENHDIANKRSIMIHVSDYDFFSVESVE